MDIRELGRLDLNLLVALEALLEERSVSKAAQRLFITQSAMSKTLGRLRELFGDPLFVRRAATMVPTPRAEQLATHLPGVLRAIQGMIEPEEFDPQTYEGEFKLMVQGHMGVWILPLLLSRLQQTGPRARFRTLANCDQPLQALAEGELDLVLHAERRRYPSGFHPSTLGFATPVLLARRGHPLEGRELNWEMLHDYPQVRLIIPEFEDIQFYAESGQWDDAEFLRREFELTPRLCTDHLYTAIRVVLSSDYLFPAPPLFLEKSELAGELISLPPPEGEAISIKYVMVHHERTDDSPAHRFLRGELLQVIEQYRHRYGLPSLGDLRARGDVGH